MCAIKDNAIIQWRKNFESLDRILTRDLYAATVML